MATRARSGPRTDLGELGRASTRSLNRSFDNLLGYLPHLRDGDGILNQTIELEYPEGTVAAKPGTDFNALLPDPGEAFGSINVQTYGKYNPATNEDEARWSCRTWPTWLASPQRTPHGTSRK